MCHNTELPYPLLSPPWGLLVTVNIPLLSLSQRADLLDWVFSLSFCFLLHPLCESK